MERNDNIQSCYEADADDAGSGPEARDCVSHVGLTPCLLISFTKSFNFIGLSCIPLTGGLLPLANLTRVKVPSPI